MNNKNVKEKAAAVFPSYKKFIAIVIAVFFGIFPFITYLKVMTLTGKTKELFPNDQGLSADFFLYWKAVALIVFAAFLILFFVGEFIFPDHRIKDIPLFRKENKFPLVCVGVYTVFAILSAALSSNHTASVMGIPTSCEGIFVLLAYMVVFLAGINYFGVSKARNIVFRTLIILAGISSLFALVEYLYKPVFQLPFMPYLIAPSQYRAVAASLHSEGFMNQVALSFYNPNYFGGFCALLFPLTLSAVIQSKTKVKKILSGGVSILFFIALMLSRSSGAAYAVFIALAFQLFLYRRQILHWLPRLGLFCFAAVVLFTAVHFASEGRFLTSIRDNLTNTTTSENTKEKYVLHDLSFQGDRLTLIGSSDTLTIINETGHSDLSALQFADQNHDPVFPVSDGDSLYFKDPRYKAVRFSIQQETLIVDLGYKDTIEFYITSDGFKAIGQNGRPLDSIPSLNPPMKNVYGIATGRGYAWVNSLPILKDCLFVGKGPDNFVFSFPQNDIVGLLNTHESAKFVIDKPHNYYLQTGINTGIVSLFAVLALFLCYLIRGARRYWSNTADVWGIGTYAGILAFLIVGLVNDSMIVVNPLFWLLLGVGYASLYPSKSLC